MQPPLRQTSRLREVSMRLGHEPVVPRCLHPSSRERGSNGRVELPLGRWVSGMILPFLRDSSRPAVIRRRPSPPTGKGDTYSVR